MKRVKAGKSWLKFQNKFLTVRLSLWAGQRIFFLHFTCSLTFVLARASSVPLTHTSINTVWESVHHWWASAHFRSVRLWMGFHARCWAPWALGHRCKATKPVSGNKHLSWANWSVKCTNCRGEHDVSAGEIAAVVGSVLGPTISWSLHSHAHISLPSFDSWVQLMPTATVATVIYWLSASFAPIHPGWLSQAKGGVCPPKPNVTAEGQQWQNNPWQAFGSFIYSTKQSPAVSRPGSLQV